MHVRGVRPGRSRDLLDMFGLCLSGLCLVHCIALPLVLIVLPAMAIFGHGAHHHGLHLALALVLVPIAFAALLPGYWRHRRAAVLAGGALGVTAILLGALQEAQFGETAATALTITGSVCLIYAHSINLMAGRTS
ncbi:MAG: MerC domain-containing protein [Burkholderiales bacterium]|nr:MerC domain-containing protein [Burkholderiales bacterium]